MVRQRCLFLVSCCVISLGFNSLLAQETIDLQKTNGSDATVGRATHRLTQEDAARAIRYEAKPGSSLTAPATHSALKQYRFAASLHDWQTAAQALVAHLVSNPAAVTYRDTLLEVYVHAGKWEPASILAATMLKQEPKNQHAQEKLAQAYQGMRRLPEALAAYHKLYEQSFSPVHLYHVANLHYQLNQVDSSLTALQELLQHPATARQSISLSVNATPSIETVPLTAAAYNLQGYIFFRKGDPKKAEALYRKALELAPSFSLAQGNLQLLQQKK